MQRIRENAYIDDMLVNCRQYQQFADEMRTQGKYYQPDHWTSYRSLAGQDQWPILGVRHSDALAYCHWLSEQEAGEWSYQLPTEEEAANFPPVPVARYPLGYWLSEQYQFVWVGPVLKDPRKLEPFREKFARDLSLERARDLATDLGLDLNRTLALDLDRVLSQARGLALALDRAIVRARLLASALAPALTRALDRSRALSPARARALNRVRDLARGRALALALARLPDRGRPADRDLQLAFDLYVDILTLQERIAGRSAAFEGIRLVKARGE